VGVARRRLAVSRQIGFEVLSDRLGFQVERPPLRVVRVAGGEVLDCSAIAAFSDAT
jgi:hypothetical protein